MQREFRRKTVTHGAAAVLLAVLLAVMCYNFGIQPATRPFSPEIKTFSSYEELKDFLRTNMELAKNFQGNVVYLSGGLEEALRTLSTDVKAAPAHSTTNIQVEGVDEADIVKTDGNYSYVVSGREVYILQAYPPEQAKVLSKIVLNDTYSVEIYINGDKLAILGSNYIYLLRYVPYAYGEESFIRVYDISDRSNPTLTRTVSLNGTFSGSRMIGDYVYAVVTQPAIRPIENSETDFEVNLPKIVVNDSVKEVEPTEIRYVDVPDAFYAFTTVIAINILDDGQEPTYEPILKSATSCIYVSTNNMYLTVPNTNWILSADTSEPRYETLIYRVKLDEEEIIWEAEGAVPGYVLNQFSMDEYNGFFRIATTIGWGENSVNNLFILNMNLSIVGNLTNLDPGKQIYAARFMGDRCYLVTFFQKDPFFVIDVSNPFEPKVLGALEIEGFSGYLHPYDENHVIGIGMEGSKVKLSLYNVTNVADPKEIDKFTVPGEWSSTTVLWDHKAFLFNKEKQLLAIPVSINWIETRNETDYYKSWQGAYIFEISLEGFMFKGSVTHQDDEASFEGGFEVKRILYIENVLYTVSDRKVKLNNLEDLTFIREIKLG